MNGRRRLLYFLAFAGTAMVAALAVSRVGRPSMAWPLLGVVLLASLAGAPGLLRRRLWPLALVLLPLGGYLVLRAELPPQADPAGVAGQVETYVRHFRAGAYAFAVQRVPLQLEGAGDLRLFIAASVYGVTAMAAFLALSLRRALAGIAVTLVMLGFGLTTDGVPRVVWLPLAYVSLAACTLALSRSFRRRRWSTGDAATGVATAVTASLLALLLLGVTSVAAGAPWADYRAWGPSGRDTVRVSFDWMTSFPGLLDPQQDAPVMEVRSPVATFWRANALEDFTGTLWSGGSPANPIGIPRLDDGLYRYTVPVTGPLHRGKLVTEVFTMRALSTEFLLAGGTPTGLALDTLELVQLSDSQALRLQKPFGRERRYAITAVVPRIRPLDLVGRGREYPPVMLRLTSLPFPRAADLTGDDPAAQWRAELETSEPAREWLDLFDLDLRVVGNATDPYEIALRIEQHLRTGYTYSLSPPETPDRSPFAAFLFRTRTGYCQHFAGAMAVWLRFNGIPARVAVGFRAGERRSDGTYLVSRTDAHAWVEAYFPGVGWASFDPTPGSTMPGVGPSSATIDFVDPYTGTAASSSAEEAEEPEAVPRRREAAAAGAAGDGDAGGATSADWLPWVLVPAAALALWPTGRAVLRRASARRGSLDRRLLASVRLVHAELRDFGVETPPSHTLRDTAQLVRSDLALDASAVTSRVEAVLYGGRAASHDDLTALADLRRQVRRRLRARAGWARTLLAAYGLSAPSP